MAEDKLAVSINDAAEMLGMKRDLMLGLLLSGEIPSFKVGARRIVSVEALRAYIARRTPEPYKVPVVEA